MRTQKPQIKIEYPETKNGLVGIVTIKIVNASKLFTGNEVQAIYGTFEKSFNNSVIYSATLWVENGTINHNYLSEFIDDLKYIQ